MIKWKPIKWENNGIFIETRDSANGVRYVITKDNRTLNKAGDWEYEPIPSNRTALYLKRTRFKTLHSAIEIADKAIETKNEK